MVPSRVNYHIFPELVNVAPSFISLPEDSSLRTPLNKRFAIFKIASNICKNDSLGYFDPDLTTSSCLISLKPQPPATTPTS
jgi:hypothetical protein